MNRSILNDIDALTAKLLQAADAQHEAGDTDAALMSADAADALMALLDHDALRRGAGRGETGATR